MKGNSNWYGQRSNYKNVHNWVVEKLGTTQTIHKCLYDKILFRNLKWYYRSNDIKECFQYSETVWPISVRLEENKAKCYVCLWVVWDKWL